MHDDLPCGIYEHYKGNKYLVIGLARHDTTQETLVIYTRLYPREGLPLSARPLGAFTGNIVNEQGQEVKRFRYVGTHE